MIALLRPQLLLAWCLAAVLVLTQTLGLIHGVTHAKGVAGANGHSQVHVGQGDQGDQYQHSHSIVLTAASPSGLLASVFALHGQDSDCRLFDQCSHGAGAASGVLQWLPVVVPPSRVAIFQGNALARWAALFDARGPPLTV